MPTPYWSRKATRRGARCECPADPAWSETLAYVDAPCTGTGRSRVRPGGGMPRRSVSGRRGAESDDERRREVRPGRSRDLPVPVQGASTYARVSDHAGSAGHSHRAPLRVAFRDQYGVGIPDITTFAAQWLAYAIPCQRFARHLAVTHA